jgi:carboxymethylenebutenolidase
MSAIYQDIALLRDDGLATMERPSGDAGTRRAVEVDRVPITVVEPERAARGGIVVLHESREFADSLLELMDSLVGENWIVVAPNLFHRGRAGEEQVFGADLFADFDACFDWLVGHGVVPDCIGVLGFDSAGTAAFLVAANRPIGAAVSVAAPGIVEPLTEQAVAMIRAAPRLQAPWLGLYGLDDPVTPVEQVEQLRDAVARAAVASLIVGYPGLGHRTARPGFDDCAVDENSAETRIFDWFDSHLR